MGPLLRIINVIYWLLSSLNGVGTSLRSEKSQGNFSNKSAVLKPREGDICPLSGFMPKTASWMNILGCCPIVTPFRLVIVTDLSKERSASSFRVMNNACVRTSNLATSCVLLNLVLRVGGGGAVLIIVCVFTHLLQSQFVCTSNRTLFMFYKSLFIQKIVVYVA